MNKAVSRFIFHPKLSNPIPQSQKSLELNLSRKAAKRSKRDRRGLWDTLAPGSTDVRISPTTTAIKERGAPELKVRNSDIAKIGTKAEQNTDLRQYAQRRPLPYDKTTVMKDRIPLERVEKEIQRRHQDPAPSGGQYVGVSSANSNISKAMSTRKLSKPRPSTSLNRKLSATPNTSPASSTSSPTNSKGKINREAPNYYEFESSVCSVSNQGSISVTKRARITNPVMEAVIQEEAAQPPLDETLSSQWLVLRVHKSDH